MATSGKQQLNSLTPTDKRRAHSVANDTAKQCITCEKSFRSCECKSCSKCGSLFQKYSMTGYEKGRSHCRVCFEAVCATCHIFADDIGMKVCTQCQIIQKETQVCKENALKAIDEAKYGKEIKKKTVDTVLYCKLKFPSQSTDLVFESAKKGDHHILVTLLDDKLNINVQDEDHCTALYFASERGHIATVALLLERGAAANHPNVFGLTCLHAIALKGSSVEHVRCAELLLEAGADPLSESEVQETPIDIAMRCNRSDALITLLRNATVSKACEELTIRCTKHSGLARDEFENRFWRSVSLLTHFFTTTAQTSTAALAMNSSTNSSQPNSSIDPPPTFSFNTREIVNAPPRSPKPRRPVADVIPIVKPTKSNEESLRCALSQTDILSLKEKLTKCEAEKKSWEDRCKTLMQSVSSAMKEKKRQEEVYKKKISNLEQEKICEINKVEAAFTNKMAKIRQEAETKISNAECLVVVAEDERKDLFQLQKQYRLTWVPDDLVMICQNSKCRSTFSSTNRKHHCRCCGRVFCHPCSNSKSSLHAFGYPTPVRLCSSCFALVDDIVQNPEPVVMSKTVLSTDQSKEKPIPPSVL